MKKYKTIEEAIKSGQTLIEYLNETASSEDFYLSDLQSSFLSKQPHKYYNARKCMLKMYWDYYARAQNKDEQQITDDHRLNRILNIKANDE